MDPKPFRRQQSQSLFNSIQSTPWRTPKRRQCPSVEAQLPLITIYKTKGQQISKKKESLQPCKTHRYANVREMLVGMLSQSCHHWLHPCSNLAWTIGQNHNIELIVIDCCRRLYCSIVVVAVRWTCDCCFYYYSAFFGPSCPPPTFCSRTQRSRGRMCNQNFLRISCTIILDTKEQISCGWKETNGQYILPHKQTRIAQNQEFFP